MAGDLPAATPEVIAAITTIEAAYATAWDTDDADGWAGLFTADGVFEFAPVGTRPARSFRGHGELAKFCRDVNAVYRGLHLMHVPDITLDGDRAHARLHFTWTASAVRGGGHVERREVNGFYHVDYHHTADGWRITRRVEHAVTDTVTEFFGGSLT